MYLMSNMAFGISGATWLQRASSVIPGVIAQQGIGWKMGAFIGGRNFSKEFRGFASFAGGGNQNAVMAWGTDPVSSQACLNR